MATDQWREPLTDLKPEVTREFTVIEGGAEEEEQLHPIEAASYRVGFESIRTRVQECPANGETYQYNLIIGPVDGGEPFGAALIFSGETAVTGPASQITEATIETFHVDDENRVPAFLAVVRNLINNDPDLRTIEGAKGINVDGSRDIDMARAAAEISPFLLKLGWRVQYMISSRHPVENRLNQVTTFDSRDLDDLGPNAKVSYSFHEVFPMPRDQRDRTGPYPEEPA